jgi:Flp pilus assembly pilin Flp
VSHKQPSAKQDQRSSRLAATVRCFAVDCSGATAVEYGVLILIGIAIMAVVSQIGGSVSGMFEMLKGAFG